MPLSDKEIQEMDQASGLSSSDISQMDKDAGFGMSSQSSEPQEPQGWLEKLGNAISNNPLSNSFFQGPKKGGQGLGTLFGLMAGEQDRSGSLNRMKQQNEQLTKAAMEALNRGDKVTAKRLMAQAQSSAAGISQDYSDVLGQADKAKTQTMQGALGTGALFVPAGESVAGMAASGATTGALNAAAQGETINPMNIALGGATGGVLGGALGLVGNKLKSSLQNMATKSIENTAEQAAEATPGTFTDKLIGNLEGKVESRTKSTLGGRFLRNIFEGLDKTDVRKIGDLNRASEELSTMIKPNSNYQDILDQATKLTGYDANGTPGLLQAVKEDALAKSGKINIDDLAGVFEKYDKQPQFSNVPDYVKSTVGNVITDYQNTFNAEGQQAAAERLFDNLKAIEQQQRFIKQAASKSPADEAAIQYLQNAKNDIMDKIDAAAVNSGALESLKNPEVLDAVEKQYGKTVRDKIANIETLSDLRRFEAPWVAASKGISKLLERGPKGQFAGKATGAATGAIGGATVGYQKGGIPGAVVGGLGGMFAGSLLPTATEAIQNEATPRILTSFARGSSGLSNLAQGASQSISNNAANTLLNPFAQKTASLLGSDILSQ